MLGMLLALSLAVTEGILLLEGRWQEALPLHLCSAAGIAALDVSLTGRSFSLDFLWYLGMPGALLALLFPAPSVSRYQLLLNLSYAATHALIVIIPFYAVAKGQRVRRRREGVMLLFLHGLAAVSYAVNRLLGTDYLFLMAPPAGTPLCIPYALGPVWYGVALEALACTMLFVTGRILPRLWTSVMN